MHIRRAFLVALRTQLKTLSGYGGVWIQRIGPTRNAFPALTLFADSETVDFATIHGPRQQSRVLTVSVLAWIRGTPDDEKAETDMDAAALAIEGVLTAPTGALDLYLIATDFTVAEDEPEVHVVTLTYRLEYITTEFNPT
jgi:hypothetical protein